MTATLPAHWFGPQSKRLPASAKERARRRRIRSRTMWRVVVRDYGPVVAFDFAIWKSRIFDREHVERLMYAENPWFAMIKKIEAAA